MTAPEWLLSLVRPVDVLEIVLVAYLLYRLYRLMRGTIAVQLFLGLVALLVVQAGVVAADMTVLQALFGAVADVFVLALVVLFQPELRRLLLLLGQNPLVRRFVSDGGARGAAAEEIALACAEMSRRRIGALIAVERTAGLRSYAETGTALHARLHHDLLVTLFYGKNPLHDGAVILRGGVVEAARCILPVTPSDLDPLLGLRHRAAVGLTEQTDAFVIVVSEETGRIATASGGVLTENVSDEALRRYLVGALGLAGGA